MTAPHASGGADRDRADRLVLPLSGWSARLRRDGGPPFRLVVDPGGGAPFTHTLLPQAARGQLVHRTRPALSGGTRDAGASRSTGPQTRGG